MTRGEVYWADLAPRSGSEQTGRRPVVVVSHDGFNQTPAWRSIIVVPISTSGLQAKRGPTVVQLPGGAAGLPKPSVAVCHQVTTLDRAKLTTRIGALPVELLKDLNHALRAAMDLDG
jgi:mRNA interferase MazF